jgi:hypothetical protein
MQLSLQPTTYRWQVFDLKIFRVPNISFKILKFWYSFFLKISNYLGWRHTLYRICRAQQDLNLCSWNLFHLKSFSNTRLQKCLLIKNIANCLYLEMSVYYSGRDVIYVRYRLWVEILIWSLSTRGSFRLCKIFYIVEHGFVSTHFFLNLMVIVQICGSRSVNPILMLKLCRRYMD